MSRGILGIHHVTAIASDPQRNIDFYVGTLGVRLVKRTVNFDDPGTYHFYYGDDKGRPGTILTFFPWPGAPRGRQGTGQLTVTSFSVPSASMGWWIERLQSKGAEIEGPFRRFDDEVLAITDDDGLKLELVASAAGDRQGGWDGGSVPGEHAIRGFHGVTLSETGYELTAALLHRDMGFRVNGSEGNRYRYASGHGQDEAQIDILCQPDGRPGSMAAGTVHHVAWRVSDDETQLWWRSRLADMGFDVTPVMDRQYFHSIYFREPGGVIFEIATDPPGFGTDEQPAELGSGLKLPPWLESRRQIIEQTLPPITLPGPDASP
jgi:glyoxalase family protein